MHTESRDRKMKMFILFYKMQVKQILGNCHFVIQYYVYSQGDFKHLKVIVLSKLRKIKQQKNTKLINTTIKQMKNKHVKSQT